MVGVADDRLSSLAVRPGGTPSPYSVLVPALTIAAGISYFRSNCNHALDGVALAESPRIELQALAA